ncbi:hypothetical protein EB796_014378 [Bugula neritina]|uniref:Carboxylic ester hydrolase n=1 Tax=Bugula neritina TaxID=10212 RepID=A0A7J7JNT5_BUGNE|nr:hypothetical protein EB796_014378 [Bugula neritina]
MAYHHDVSILIPVWIVLFSIANGEPLTEVILKHGGKLRGLRTSFHNTPVNLFLGVRYAQPPVGELRFQKPKEPLPWEGVVDALKSGNRCAQSSAGAEYEGDEDCLFLDITVPVSSVSSPAKPVMVYFHGGNYIKGAGFGFIGGPLAVTGDLIVITVNYRLGLFGFLFDGKGTGNYGLWDQRAALLWVKQNIAQFGGDPDLVTIFGESAGGGSVSAHTISQHSNGLFKRAIQQSGSLYSPFSWFTSERSVRYQRDIISSLRSRTNCLSTAISSPRMLDTPVYPAADDDFFLSEVDNRTYRNAEKYDLLIGFNEQEGLAVYYFDAVMYARDRNISLADGVTMAFIQDYLTEKCDIWFTPYSIELCVDFIIQTYRLDTAAGDKERAVMYIYFLLTIILGDNMFVADTVSQTEQHTKSGTSSTYAYYFTEPLKNENRLWPKPSWMRSMAGHLDDLKYLFGAPLLANETSTFWQESDVKLSCYDDNVVQLCQVGKPKLSSSFPEGTPTWPEFTETIISF